ncbi:hypothetical protein PILCRDRAFT_11384 [Piloderma croceum F 1598]|uniref:Uncharacterized protein n=1 Tax=Piloderma croceum (strain F 1598) TaxID=765440 RepID=A0A0C3AVX6_PILCF|nr:hypothetical protein PILCRDRAFT_11384 [Piloderma croceum F 1598]
MPTTDAPSGAPQRILHPTIKVPKGLITDHSDDPLQAVQITEASTTKTTIEDFPAVDGTTSRKDDSYLLYNLTTSILENREQATPILNLNVALYLFHNVTCHLAGVLASSLQTRFEQSGHLEDLDEAISTGMRSGCDQQVIRIDPAPSATLRARYERDLSNALELRPTGHPNQFSSLNSLANSLRTRFEQSGQLEDLDEAMELYPESIDSQPRGHPSICGFSRNFGRALFSAYSHTHESKYLGNTMDTYRAAVRCESASTQPSMDAYLVAIKLLPRLAMLGSDLQARQRGLTSGQYEKAVELLEEGRAIFWSQALQLCAPMTRLHKVAPELGKKLKSLSFALEQGSLRDTSRGLSDKPQKVKSMEQETRHFYRLNVEWLETLEKVRRLHEFQDFLRPSRISTLQGAAVNATVVILNASKSGCDGLTMTFSDVKHIPFPGLSFAVVKILIRLIQTTTARNSLLPGDFIVQVGHFFQQKSFVSDATRTLRRSVEDRHMKRVLDTPVEPEDVFRYVLSALWTFAIRPVIDSLNLEKRENPPNLIWCPTRPFAFLPINAAGFYYGATTESVSDYIVVILRVDNWCTP